MLFRLIVMRHAKSDWSTPAPTDHARPLNARGRRDAPRIGKRLVKLGWQPQHVLCSDALRTRQTCDLLLSKFSPQPTVELVNSFYHGGLSDLENAVAPLSTDVDTVLVLGHNPGWQEALALLCGQPVSLTTANAALLTMEADCWAGAISRRGCWQLHEVLRPKEL
jgi:phosphohistidine phosphatase